MNVKIQGTKYHFEIVANKGKHNDCFYIRAVCNDTGRTSCINNLNAIMSKLAVDPIKPKYADSMWIVSKREGRHLFDTARKNFLDPHFLGYLEKKLDDDRLAGEWEN